MVAVQFSQCVTGEREESVPQPLLGVPVQITLIQVRILDKYAEVCHLPQENLQVGKEDKFKEVQMLSNLSHTEIILHCSLQIFVPTTCEVALLYYSIY